MLAFFLLSLHAQSKTCMAAREKYDEALVVAQLHDPNLSKAAFGKVIEHYSSQLYWQIRRMVIDHDDADMDLVRNLLVVIIYVLDRIGEKIDYRPHHQF